MLCLSRKRQESVIITIPGYEPVTVTVVDVRGDKVKLAFDAPLMVKIHRREVQAKVDAAAMADPRD